MRLLYSNWIKPNTKLYKLLIIDLDDRQIQLSLHFVHRKGVSNYYCDWLPEPYKLHLYFLVYIHLQQGKVTQGNHQVFFIII